MKYVTWVGMGVVSLVMLAGGGAKLMGEPAALDSFGKLGLPSWFGTFIGVSELAGAVGIWVRKTSMLAAIGISIVMIGALYYHIAFPPMSAGLPATVVLLICAYIVSKRGTGIIG